MSEITPPLPPAPPTAPSAPPPTAAISNPPPALVKELSLGARLDAVITGTTGQGTPGGTPGGAAGRLVEIETPFGRVALQTNFPLPPDGTLQLQLTAKGPQLLFLITAIHGLNPQAALRSLGLLATPSSMAAVQAAKASIPSPASPAVIGTTGTPGAAAGIPTGAPSGNIAIGATLVATLLKAGPVPMSAATGQPPGAINQANQGGQSPRPGQAVQPGLGAGPSAGAATKAGPASPLASAAFPAGATPAGAGGASQAASSFPPGTLFNLRITAFQPPPGASPQATGTIPPPPPGGSLIPGDSISGVVIGRASQSGNPIVQTHSGSITVSTQTPVSTGTIITFDILSQTPPAAATGVYPGTHASPLSAMLGGNWPGLEEAVSALQEINPSAARQLIHAALPRPGLTMSANILFFLAAITSGDLRGWIGDGPARILLKNRPDLFNRLRDDLGRLRTIADEPRAGDWRTFLIPFHNDNAIEQIRLFKRTAGEQPEDDGEEGRKGTRFILDLELSRLGRLQIDGLVYEKEKRLDLIVRTENKLATKMQNDIRNIFENANGVTGLKGRIVFQAAPPDFIKVEGLEAAAENLGLIV